MLGLLKPSFSYQIFVSKALAAELAWVDELISNWWLIPVIAAMELTQMVMNTRLTKSY